MNIMQIGFITDNQDPDKLGRVKMSVFMARTSFTSDWLPVICGFAGDDKGIYSLPDSGDLVLALFTDNSYRQGYVLGGLWPQQAVLPLSEENSDADLNSDGNNSLHYLRSRSGQRIIFDDTEGAGKIQILGCDGSVRIELDGENEVINLISETDISISSAGTLTLSAEDILIESEGDFTLACENLGVEVSGDTGLKAGGSLTMEGKTIGLN